MTFYSLIVKRKFRHNKQILKKQSFLLLLVLLMFNSLAQKNEALEQNNMTHLFAKALGQNKVEYSCWIINDSIYFNKTIGLKKNDDRISITKINCVEKNPQKIGLSIVCDTNSQHFKNRIYIAWADQKNGFNNWDVFLIYSTDEGAHWTEPILLTYHPNHQSQYSPCMNLNQTNGELFICYFDKQNYFMKEGRDIYLAKSKNGGLKFETVKLNTQIIKSDNLHKNVLLFKKGESKFFWRNIKALNQVLTDDILNELEPFKPDSLIEEVTLEKVVNFQEALTINFNCKSKTRISFAITKPIDPAFGTKLVTTKTFKKGNNQLLIDMKALKLNKSNYTLTLYFKGLNKYIWITEE